MNKLNHFTILLGTIVLVLITYIVFDITRQSVTESKSDFLKYKKIANEYTGIKKSFISKKDIRILLDKIAKLYHIKDIKITTYKRVVKVNINNEKLYNVDKFVNKILNSKVIIRELEIKNNSVSLKLGIK
jgi:hypothetical protein